MNTQHYMLTNTQLVGTIADQLVHEGIWFQIEPRPNDRYRLTVKDESGLRRMVEGLIDTMACAGCGAPMKIVVRAHHHTEDGKDVTTA